MTNSERSICGFITILLLLTLIAGCDFLKTPTVLEKIHRDGTLVVLTRNSQTTYYEGADGLAGFEYELVKSFADDMGVEVEFRVLDSISEILTAMRNGEGHIAAASLTRTSAREQTFLFGPDYLQVQQQVICRRGQSVPKSPEDLVGVRLMVIKDSSYEERLRELQEEIPDLTWESTDEYPTEQLLERVWEEEIDCTVADSNIVAVNRRHYPELVVAFPITDKQSIAWILKNNAYQLREEIEFWLERYDESDALVTLRDRYYSHLEIFDYVDIRAYHRRINERLPPYQPYFKEAGDRYGIPWALLAAQAYQESHWDNSAVSPTGVKGIMMLTRKTAAQLRVKNRLDPKQSILGGAKYMSQLLLRVPERVVGPDRIWFALAAYNVGMGHVYDAQVLAERFGKDPYKWRDLKTVLPLLSKRKYYKTLKHGYARGYEPVKYVQRIREFYDILAKQT